MNNAKQIVFASLLLALCGLYESNVKMIQTRTPRHCQLQWFKRRHWTSFQ